MAIIDDEPKREPESRLSLLADLVEIISIHSHLLDYPREVERLMSTSNPSLLTKIKGKQPPSGDFKKRGHKRVPRKLAVVVRPSALKRELSSEFHRVIQRFHGVKLKLIMEKALTGSDKNRDLGRISLPSSNVVEDFFRPEERHYLENREEILVLVISPSLEVSKLS
ncbi:hypothetical protein SAY86_014823 [Trapa natans]|uniref:Uncharacterized protein n=1 Tax=Trapa natans TaxID=22666 RepID=A0AAN7QH21_TRANT|nr:hypothetical protein SAY86_014823 [Trapa natans]